MQKRYKIGVNLSEYYQKTESGQWQYPKPEKRYVSNGYYYRGALDENGNKIKRLKIKRYKRRKGKGATLSLLPEMLIPYQIYSIPMMSQILYFWLIKELSIKGAIDKIYKIFNNKVLDMKSAVLDNLSGAQLYSFKKIFARALTKYLIWQKMPRIYPLEQFLIECSMNNYQQACVLSDNYYQDHSGRFLFGLPSQKRGKPH